MSAFEALDEDQFTDVVRGSPSPFTITLHPCPHPSPFNLALQPHPSPSPFNLTLQPHPHPSNLTLALQPHPHQVRGYDEVSRLDAHKTSILLEIKTKIKDSGEDIT